MSGSFVALTEFNFLCFGRKAAAVSVAREPWFAPAWRGSHRKNQGLQVWKDNDVSGSGQLFECVAQCFWWLPARCHSG